MAKQLYTGDRNNITKHTNWNGDESIENKPLSGADVQWFIKNQLEGKYGEFYYDEANTRYLVFADAEDRDLYLENPEANASLLLNAFKAPFPYKATIVLDANTNTYNAIALGKKGNVIGFKCSITEDSGLPTGEDVTITYTIRRGAYKQTITERRQTDTDITFNVDEYLDEGTNIITIGIVGNVSLAATTVGITYQVVNLALSDSMDLSTVYSENTLEVPFTVSGPGLKTLDWYVDGIKLDKDSSTDEITQSSLSITKFIPIGSLEDGRHNVQFRASTVVNNETFYSDTLYRDFIVYRGSSANTIIAVAATIPDGEIIPYEGALVLSNISQYETYTLQFGVYNPVSNTTNVTVELDGADTATLEVINGEEQFVSLIPTTVGSKTIKITANSTVYNIPVSIDETTMNIKENTASLVMDFRAAGRTNSSINKDSWSQNGITATFSGFDWNKVSGWNNNQLYVGAGDSLSFDYAPLGGNPSQYGKTFEIEFESTNVQDDDAVILDLTTSGVGLLITGTNITLTSNAGQSISRRYKSEEPLRLTVVIEAASESTNRSLMSFYFNGIISATTQLPYSSSVASSKLLTIAPTAAGVIIDQIRIYDTALSSEAVMNNFILYRRSSVEMLAAYNRNDLKTDNNDWDLDKMASYLPVMIVTGNIPTIEGTTDKKLPITVDAEYTNLQDPTRSFSIKNAILTGQGTSSMTYPKKNFRLYTQKSDATVLYDANGNVVEDRLYSFKSGAQPVNCWCFKADFAESSGTHNTGVARLWNDVMKNTQLDGQYVLRTKAQAAAIENNYPYDVRTAVDGFPILMFYRLTENSPLIFIGKYNFNNDKSTESVFGFTDLYKDDTKIFDGSKVECWEFLDSANSLALFNDISNFDSRWSDAWESRYPDTKTPNTANLKALATWINSTKNNITKWNNEIEDHFDLPKLAAYYVYLMRFGGVDQTVKNAMLETEDGQHYFFINYDNDTVMGVRNDGWLVYDPDITRETWDPSLGGGGYAYAGHDSVLWNNFEASEKCMAMAKSIDNALYSAGLSYENAIEMFNEEQAGKWAESIYNQDAQYKYIDTYKSTGNGAYLPFCQGSRSDHRKWWLANRFALLDGQFENGAYIGNSISFTVGKADAGQYVKVTAAKPQTFGFGANNRIWETKHLDADETYNFELPQEINVGSPPNIYAPAYIKELDLSNLASNIQSNFKMGAVKDPVLGTQLKKLILGINNGVLNTSLQELGGLSNAEALEYLDISGYKNIKNIDLSNLYNLTTFKADNSGLTSATFATGGSLETVSLPATLQSLTLNSLSKLTPSGLNIESWDNITTISIKDCPNFADSFNLIYNWFKLKSEDDYSKLSLTMSGINWTNVDEAKFLELVSAKSSGMKIDLSGTIELTSGDQTTVDELLDLFEDNTIFTKGAKLYIILPDAIFISGPVDKRVSGNDYYEYSILEGESIKFTAAAFLKEVTEDVKISFTRFSRSTATGGSTAARSTGHSLSTDGTFTSTEIEGTAGASTRFTIFAQAIGATTGTLYKQSSINVLVAPRTYPTEAQIDTNNWTISITENQSGDTFITYPLEYTTDTINGRIAATWALENGEEGSILDVLEIYSQDDAQCVLKLKDTPNMDPGTLTVTLTKKYVDSTWTVSKSVTISTIMAGVAFTKYTNPGMNTMMHGEGWASDEHPNYTLISECASITSNDLQPGTTTTSSIFYKYRDSLTDLSPFRYFINVDYLSRYMFWGCSKVTKIEFPTSITRTSYIIDTSGNVLSGLINVPILDLSNTSLNKIDGLFNDGRTADTGPIRTIILPNNTITITYVGWIVAESNQNFYNAKYNLYGLGTTIIYTPTTMTFENPGRTNLFMPIYRWIGYVNSIKLDITPLPVSMRPTVQVFDPNSESYRTVIIGTNRGSNFLGWYNYPIKFTAPTGFYYDDVSTSKEFVFQYDENNLVLKTIRVDYMYSTLKFTTSTLPENVETFNITISYTNNDGEEVTETKSYEEASTTGFIVAMQCDTHRYVKFSCSEIEGYSCQDGITDLAQNGTVTQNIIWTPSWNVKILHTNGTEYEIDAWNTDWNENAVGITLENPDTGYKTLLYPYESESALAFANSMSSVTYMGGQAGYPSVYGSQITKNLISQNPSTTFPAANWAAETEFKNGVKGHLPAWYEYKNLTLQSSKVNKALRKIGGDEFDWGTTSYLCSNYYIYRKDEAYNITMSATTTGKCRAMYELTPPVAKIKHENGNLYTLSEWKSAGYEASEAIGVNLHSSYYGKDIVVSRDELNGQMSTATYSNSDIQKLIFTYDYNSSDWNGEFNTEALNTASTTVLPKTARTTYITNATNSPCYIPSWGQFQLIWALQDDLNEMLTEIGGTTFDRTKSYFTSSIVNFTIAESNFRGWNGTNCAAIKTTTTANTRLIIDENEFEEGVYIKYWDNDTKTVSYSDKITTTDSSEITVDTTKQVVGISVKMDNHGITLHPTRDAYGQLLSGNVAVPGLEQISVSVATTRFNGKECTELIRDYTTKSSYTSSACTLAGDVSYADGSKGWLPSVGELNILRINVNLINAALEAVGGSKLNFGGIHYWTSNQFSATAGLYWSYYNQGFDGNGKTYSYRVRSVAAF